MNDTTEPIPGDTEEPIVESFIRVLIFDVQRSRERYALDDSQSNARDLVRVTFAAIEGLTWMVRETVLADAEHRRLLNIHEVAAMRDKTYSVNENGVVKEQDRFIPLVTTLRMMIRIAERTLGDYKVDLQHVGWTSLLKAVKVRNRVTHPKNLSALKISKDEVDACIWAFHWHLALCLELLNESRKFFAKLNEDEGGLPGAIG